MFDVELVVSGFGYVFDDNGHSNDPVDDDHEYEGSEVADMVPQVRARVIGIVDTEV